MNTTLRLSFLLSVLPATGDAALAAANSWESLPDGSSGQVSEFRGADGTPIAAYVRKPPGDGPFPVVVMVHGGGDSKAGTYALGRKTSAPTADFIARGWAVYSIDFRPKSSFLPVEWDDTCRAVETVRQLPFIDPQRVAMIGGSHGGYVTARVAARCDLRSAIACAPAAIDLAEVAKAKAAGFKLSPNLERVLANPPASDAPAVFDEVDKVRCPLLLISGRNDSSSPPSVMEAYAAKLKTAGKEVELYLPDNGPHGFYFGRPAIPETDEAARRAVAFIAKHFGVTAKPVAVTASAERPAPDRARRATPSPDSTAAGRSLLQPKTFPSTALKGEASYTIYLPPSYAREPSRRFPVVFWLHGGGGGPGDVWRFAELIDGAIKAGKCPPMIVVGVDGRVPGAGARTGSQYSDWKDGSLPMETAIIKDLLPHIDATYRTLGTREGRALEGFSMGGHGALHLAFKHAELFGAVTALGPALIMPESGASNVDRVYRTGAYQGDEAYWRLHDPLTLAENHAAELRGRQFIRLITGEVEGNFTHRRTIELSQKLKSLGIEHEFIRPGETGHNYAKYYDALPQSYEFYAKAFADLSPSRAASAVGEKSAALAPEPAVAGKAPTGAQPVASRKAPSERGGPPRWVDPDVTAPSGTQYRTFRSGTIKGEVSYLVYLPPDYEKDGARRYPALFWLHGGGGNQRGGTRFVEQLDQAIRAGKAPPMVVILVNGLPSGFYNDSGDGQRPVESIIVRDLIPHVDATYRTITDRSARGIEGFSMGGYGAAHLGFKYPELFGVVSNLAGAVIDVEFFATYQNGRILQETFNGDRAAFERNHPLPLARQNVAAIRGRTFVRILVGDADTGRGTLEANRTLHRALDEMGIAHDYTEVPGVGHNFVALYERLGMDAFGFFQRAFPPRGSEMKP